MEKMFAKNHMLLCFYLLEVPHMKTHTQFYTVRGSYDKILQGPGKEGVAHVSSSFGQWAPMLSV